MPWGHSEQKPFQFDLTYDSSKGKFTGSPKFGFPILGDRRNGGKFQTGYRHEIAIVVDGQWLRNPSNETSNFPIDLYDLNRKAGTCYQPGM